MGRRIITIVNHTIIIVIIIVIIIIIIIIPIAPRIPPHQPSRRHRRIAVLSLLGHWLSLFSCLVAKVLSAFSYSLVE